MNKSNLAWGMVGLVSGLLLASLFVSARGIGVAGYGNMMMGGLTNSTQPNRMMGAIDAHFIEQMIPHHDDAITMAKIALEKAEHQEIKQLAQNINRTQSEEIETMKKWYRDWYGKEVPDVFKGTSHGMGSGLMHMGMMGSKTDIDKLKNATTFDKVFIEQMIPHHQMAVMMAQMLEQATARPEMKRLAQDIIKAQTKEINDMREWYSQWYVK